MSSSFPKSVSNNQKAIDFSESVKCSSQTKCYQIDQNVDIEKKLLIWSHKAKGGHQNGDHQYSMMKL